MQDLQPYNYASFSFKCFLSFRASPAAALTGRQLWQEGRPETRHAFPGIVCTHIPVEIMSWLLPFSRICLLIGNLWDSELE